MQVFATDQNSRDQYLELLLTKAENIPTTVQFNDDG